MTIYVDTNAIPPHGPLDSIDLSALRAVVMEHGFDVALPRMVVEESIGQRRRHVRAAIERVRSAQHAVREFWKVESPPPPDLDDTVEQWRTHLEGRFRIVETPANAANEALAREIHRIPPTRDGKGARDAVIWLSIIDDIKGTDGESNFLITSNKKGSPKVRVGHCANRTRGGRSRMLVQQSMIIPMSADAEWKP